MPPRTPRTGFVTQGAPMRIPAGSGGPPWYGLSHGSRWAACGLADVGLRCAWFSWCHRTAGSCVCASRMTGVEEVVQDCLNERCPEAYGRSQSESNVSALKCMFQAVLLSISQFRTLTTPDVGSLAVRGERSAAARVLISSCRWNLDGSW